jgi:hypothetical protein
VGQRVVFRWFWGRGTSNSGLARQKLDKKTHPNQGGRHCPMAAMVPSAPPPAPPHTAISQHAARQVYVIKTREYYCFTVYLLAILRHNASLMRSA